jgi:NTP pyrophosphatase (non-canonical NTP hydrolase)
MSTGTTQKQIEKDHSEMVEELVKNPKLIISKIDAKKMDLIHMALGVAGEAGELVDAIKKYAIYDHELDLENVIEELGDLEFYMERVRDVLDLSRHDILQANILKLRKRYPKKYTDEHAALRLDKSE